MKELNTCRYCGKPLQTWPDEIIPERTDSPTIDHFVPSVGGKAINIPENKIEYVCYICNQAKANLMPADFISDLRTALNLMQGYGGIPFWRIPTVIKNVIYIIEHGNNETSLVRKPAKPTKNDKSKSGLSSEKEE